MKRKQPLVITILIAIALMLTASLSVYSTTFAPDLVCTSNPCIGTPQNNNLTAVCFSSPKGTTVQGNNGAGGPGELREAKYSRTECYQLTNVHASQSR